METAYDVATYPETIKNEDTLTPSTPQRSEDDNSARDAVHADASPFWAALKAARAIRNNLKANTAESPRMSRGSGHVSYLQMSRLTSPNVKGEVDSLASPHATDDQSDGYFAPRNPNNEPEIPKVLRNVTNTYDANPPPLLDPQYAHVGSLDPDHESDPSAAQTDPVKISEMWATVANAKTRNNFKQYASELTDSDSDSMPALESVTTLSSRASLSDSTDDSQRRTGLPGHNSDVTDTQRRMQELAISDAMPPIVTVVDQSSTP
ncbi:hypothetical protein B0H11DRAFT_1912381 [Mycena galericulata]|nr:hypothetical protein B0H11DRAFT_1912381 [Mycena galericulata]